MFLSHEILQKDNKSAMYEDVNMENMNFSRFKDSSDPVQECFVITL